MRLSWWGVLLLGLAACTPAPSTPTPQPNPQPELCGGVFVFGQPVGQVEGTQFLCRSRYAVLHSRAYKVPLYSAQRLSSSDLEGTVSRTDDFRPDSDLPSADRAELEDYRGSGYDRGHMAPAGDFSTDAMAMSESFLLSNMVPQNSTMNSGIWAGLESATRACAKSVGTVYVLTGPVFDNPIPTKTIGPNQVGVPDKLYKVIVEPTTGNSRAYLMPNTAIPSQPGFTNYRVSIDTVEAATGLDFFPLGSLDEAGLGTLCLNTYGF